MLQSCDDTVRTPYGGASRMILIPAYHQTRCCAGGRSAHAPCRGFGSHHLNSQPIYFTSILLIEDPDISKLLVIFENTWIMP